MKIGSWEVDAHPTANTVGVATSDGYPICDIFHAVDGWSHATGGATAKAWKLQVAHAIAAAPDMLRACEAALYVITTSCQPAGNTDVDDRSEIDAVTSQLRAAIAKACNDPDF